MMILGRPVNLWNGLVVATISLISIVVMQLLPDVDSEVVATIGAAATLFFGAVIMLIANATPTVREGDAVHVVTEGTEPNRTITA